MKKVYAVYSHYDDFGCFATTTILNGIFDNPFDAQSLLELINKKNDILKSETKPNSLEEFIKWEERQELAEALKKVYIEEYNVNEIITK